ncbi:hypothetical protein PORY_000415 [Pneumocystis oryctolagi]|uniref:Uncharacterized protein n=1 Tax=Pneumocystis oryctolagi TaxID=42067 RepID=A0ACB7CGR1_9ASCO|nr:hypothetical protein PORY_000415 [Pneumocystis oryctolagi]
MINAVLIFNNSGKPRLIKFYSQIDIAVQKIIVEDIYKLICSRPSNVCNFLEGNSVIGDKNLKIVYRNYATLYFVFIIDQAESELMILDLIQIFVEVLDKCYENVCELDLIFNFENIHAILSEIICGGMILNTNVHDIVSRNKKSLNNDIWDELGEDIVPQNINQNNHNVYLQSNYDNLEEKSDELMSTLKESSKNKPTKKKENKSLTKNSKISNNNLSEQFDSSLNQNDLSNNEKHDQNSETILEIKLKTKREKEKEKKEREKAKKKAQSEIKKTMDKSVIEKEKNQTSEVDKTKKQVDKTKEQVDKTKEQVDKTKKQVDETKEHLDKNGIDTSTHESTSTRKNKAKMINIAALQKQIELRMKAEEEKRREEEEERKRIEEEERKIQEEEEKRREAKARKKEREKARKEELKSQGKFLTKKQKEQQQIAQIKIQQLLATGVKIEGLSNKIDANFSNKSNRLVYDSRKKKPRNNTKNINSNNTDSDIALNNDVPKNDDTEKLCIQNLDINQEKSEDSEDDIIDDWENAFDYEDNNENNNNSNINNINNNSCEIDTENIDISNKDAELKSFKADISNSRETDINYLEAEHLNTEEKINQDISTKQNSTLSSKKGSKNIENNLRSPICCILGHVDTGKTKILDKIRQTNVQEGEAGGITQQIGATYFPMDSIKQKISVLDKNKKLEYKIPGLLIIDTPGHESFTNLRSRGSSLCDIAILVVDIMHGLERQTIESLRLLKDRKTPFIVALNKIDRIYGWNSIPDNAFQESLSKQGKSVQREFHNRYTKIITEFSERGLNAVAYYDNKNFAKNVSIVPTSALTGEGIPDMLMLLVNLTQQRMSNKLMYLSKLEATVLEVKITEGHGTTIDVILSNGVLKEGDRIVLCGLNGAISTNIRALLTPQPLKELRVKSIYQHNKEVKAASGVKISANDLDKAIAGSRLMVVGPNDNEEELKEEIMKDLEGLLSFIDTAGVGVSVQASTLGSLEALLEFLKQNKIPKIMESKKQENASEAIFPCVLKTIAVFNKKDPILLGVDIIEGVIRIGTPICAVKVNPSTQEQYIVDLGKIVSIEKDHKVMNMAKKEHAGKGVAIKIESASQILFGRQVDEKDLLYSHISRKSIDILKEIFRNEVSKEEWNLIRKLKTTFNIP